MSVYANNLSRRGVENQVIYPIDDVSCVIRLHAMKLQNIVVTTHSDQEKIYYLSER